MSGHSVTKPTSMPTTQEAFFADRQRVWSRFTGAAVWGVVFVILLLVGMAIFLL